MIGRITSAALRGIAVALLVTTPPLLLPGIVPHATEIIVFLALVAGFLTFIEYSADYPSVVEFRDAPPLNRIRFAGLFLMILGLTILFRHGDAPTPLTEAVTAFAQRVGLFLDTPYSPVRFALSMLPAETPVDDVDAIRRAAGLAFSVSVSLVAVFFLVVRLFGWPTASGAFNVWVNLPLFDPTGGGDVVYRMRRDAWINITLGLLLPFLLPALANVTPNAAANVTVGTPQSLIWTIAAWAFLPASIITRGIALFRVAELIAEKRRRGYAGPEAVQTA